MKKICLLMSLLLCLGTTALAQERTAMGRYMEQALANPYEGGYQFAQGAGGLVAVSDDGTALYVSEDGKEWTGQDSGHDPDLYPMRYIMSACIGPDGSVYLAGNMEKGTDEEGIVERIENGVAQRVPLQINADQSFQIRSMAVTGGGDVLLLNYMGKDVLRFSPDGQLVKKYPFQGAYALAVYGGELAVYEGSIQQVTILDLDTGAQLRRFAAPEGADSSMPLAYGPDGTLTMATRAGVFTVTPGGSLMTQMLDGSLTSLAKPTLMIGGLGFDGAGDPVIRLVDLSTWQSSLLAYKFDPAIPTEPTSQITVFTLYDDPTLHEAIARTQAQHPEAKVNLEVGLPQDTAITRDDAIRTLNTQILAGNGPDVLVLDGLPIKSYIDKGVLMDLAPTVRPLMEAGKLVKNVAGAFEAGPAVPALPTRFLLPTLWGDLSGIASMEDMAQWAAANPDAIPLFAMEPSDLIGEFYLSCAPAWTGADGRLDEGKLAQFLTLIKQIRGDWNYGKVTRAVSYDFLAQLQERSILPPQWDPYTKDYGDSIYLDILAYVAQGKVHFMPYVLRGMENASTPNGVIAHVPGGSFMPMPGQAQGVYVPTMVLGINQASPNAPLAQAFLLQMLSDPVQSIEPIAPASKGFPVNRAALQSALASTESPTGAVETWGEDLEATWLDEGQRAQLGQIIDALHTPSLPDFTLCQMVIDLSTPFFQGEMDAQEAAAAIAAKAGTYLSE